MTGQPHFDSSIISHPTSRPSYGAGATVESGAYGDEYYEEDEDSWELEEEIAKLEENYGCKFYSSPDPPFLPDLKTTHTGTTLPDFTIACLNLSYYAWVRLDCYS